MMTEQKDNSEFEGVHMMKRNKITALLYFIMSLLFCVSGIRKNEENYIMKIKKIIAGLLVATTAFKIGRAHV